MDDVCDLLAGMTGSLVFLALPRDEQDQPEKTKPQQAVVRESITLTFPRAIIITCPPAGTVTAQAKL